MSSPWHPTNHGLGTVEKYIHPTGRYFPALDGGLVMPDNIVLIGLSFTGKSTVGRILARRLGRRFVDTDTLITKRAGKTPQEIFASHGESGFRSIEKEVVCEALSLRRAVISAGGGAALDPENRARMRDENVVLLLRANPETLALRLRLSRNSMRRPLLDVEDPVATLKAMAEARRDAYSIAHLTLSTDDKTPEEVAEEAHRLLIAYGYL